MLIKLIYRVNSLPGSLQCVAHIQRIKFMIRIYEIRMCWQFTSDKLPVTALLQRLPVSCPLYSVGLQQQFAKGPFRSHWQPGVCLQAELLPEEVKLPLLAPGLEEGKPRESQTLLFLFWPGQGLLLWITAGGRKRTPSLWTMSWKKGRAILIATHRAGVSKQF